jgi:AraC-like DNA-binding protein
VLVFHFRLLPKVAEQPLGSRSHFRVDLGKVACARLIELGRRVTHYWRNPSPGMLLVAESVRAELSFLVYEGFSDAGIPAKSAGAEQVGRALEVYGARMAENPTLGEIAAAAGLSVAHLRRLFHAHMGHSPKEAFDQLRERRILELLTDSDYSLEAIAEATGFSEASALSRAFKKRFGSPPSAMRRRLSG